MWLDSRVLQILPIALETVLLSMHNWRHISERMSDHNLIWKTTGTDISNVNTGNVGIGIEFAQAKLHVLSTATDGSEVARFNWLGNSYITLFTNNTQASYWGSDGVNTSIKNNGTGWIGFWKSGFPEQLVIANNGNVGIWTISPGVKLEIATMTDNPIRLNKTSGPKEWNYIEFTEWGNRKAWIGRALNNTFAIWSDNATQDFYFDGFRNVGIGTSNPQAKLQKLKPLCWPSKYTI